jgi:hypothetical protein
MRHNTWLPIEFRDLMIGILALALAIAIWALILAPAAV